MDICKEAMLRPFIDGQSKPSLFYPAQYQREWAIVATLGKSPPDEKKKGTL